MTREEFFPSYAKTKALYDLEYPEGSKKPWHYDKPSPGRALDELYKDVIDPATNEYYLSKTGEKPKKTITSITRFRTLEGEEYLLTIGSVKFYDMYKNVTVKACNKQEMHDHPDFIHKSRPDDRGHVRVVTTEVVPKNAYDVPFTAENIDNLLKLQGPTGCTFNVIDERTGNGRECPTLEMFKNKDFNYILNSEWQTPEEKEIAIKEHEAIHGKLEPKAKR